MGLGLAVGIGSAIYGGGKALGLWGKPPKQTYKQSAEEKAYFAELERRSREGIGVGGRFRAQNVMTSRLASAEQSQRLAQKGQALFAGTRGVASRETAKVGQESMYRALVEGSLDISDRDEMAKLRAQEKLGQLGLEKSRRESEMAYSNAMAQYGSRQAGMSQLFAGLSSIASSLNTPDAKSTFESILGKGGESYTDADNAFLLEHYLKSDNPEQFQGMLLEAGIPFFPGS